MKGFTNWLIQEKGLAQATAENNTKLATKVSDWFTGKDMQLKTAVYADLLPFIEHCRDNRGLGPAEINRYLVATAWYLAYLHRNSRSYANPAAGLRIAGVPVRKPFGVFSRTELDGFYDNFPVTGQGSFRCKILLGLTVFQALRKKELEKLQAGHPDFNKGTIYVPGSRTSESRTLKLEPGQIMPLYSYTETFEHKTDFLFTANMIHYFYRRLKKYFPGIKNTFDLRNSVITGWTKNHNLRQVQYMAGHRLLTSTEKYRQDTLEGLQRAVENYHPLDNKK
jgi:site-specific recombinase XerD